MKKFILIVLTLIGFTLAAQAQSQTPQVTKRQVKQQKRIAQGARTGELTYGEAQQLKRQQGDIRRTKRRAKADGEVTGREKAVIHHKQNKANRNIRRKKHNPVSKN